MAKELLVPDNLLYTREHEWVLLLQNGNARVGITDYAQHELGDIVHVEMPEVEKRLEKGDTAAETESVKSVASVYAPVTGTVVACNESLDPADVNGNPYDKGWLFEMSCDTTDGLLNPTEYRGIIS